MSGVYVHIPFCHAKCGYCDFYSRPGLTDEVEAGFLEALGREWESRRGELTEPIETIYIGGGTPSSLSRKGLTRLFLLFRDERPVEVTIEVNPEDVTDGFSRFLVGMTPVNRVSMGVQSLNDSELRTIGRRHTGAEAMTAVERLRAAGIDNLSLDLMYGLPGQTLESFEESLVSLREGARPEHLSAYILSYEPGTRLSAKLLAGKISEAPERLIEEMYMLLTETTRRYGFEHYEISNFALAGRRSRHNSNYWNQTPYLGLSPGAHSFTGNRRSYNPPRLRDYVAQRGLDFNRVEEETDDNRFDDMLITRLRTAEGLDLDTVAPERRVRLLNDAREHIDEGRLISDGHKMRIAEGSWLISDAVIRDLMQG